MIRTTTIALIALIALALAHTAQARGSHAARGYVTKQGTYVAPHRATNPNGTKRDNWSTKGNVNPNTGKQGSKK